MGEEGGGDEEVLRAGDFRVRGEVFDEGDRGGERRDVVGDDSVFGDGAFVGVEDFSERERLGRLGFPESGSVEVFLRAGAAGAKGAGSVRCARWKEHAACGAYERAGAARFQ